MSQTILTDKSGYIASIRLNRPESYNSFTREMALALIEQLKQYDKDEEVRVILLTGQGKAFCAGQDLKEVTDPETNIGFERIVDEHYNSIIRTLVSISKPVLAAINGVAAGAGANIALACDIVVAKKSASFIQAFSKIGLIPDSGGTFILPRLIGFQKAKALCMLGDKLSSEEAEKMGLIYKFFEDDTFEESSMQLAEKLAALPPIGLSYTKKLFAASPSNNLEAQLDLEKKYQVLAGDSEDYKECVQAFLEKRKPIIKGK